MLKKLVISLLLAVAIACGYTDIIPTECSCTKMIELLKNIGTAVVKTAGGDGIDSYAIGG